MYLECPDTIFDVLIGSTNITMIYTQIHIKQKNKGNAIFRMI